MVNPFTALFMRLRTYTAFLSTALLNLRPAGIDYRNVCAYGFNCHGCSLASAACPVGIMAYGSAVRAFPRLALAMVLTIGVLFGRLVCGYACPFGLFQDLMHRIPSPKLKLPKVFRYVKYLLLILLVFTLPYAFGMVPLGYLESDKPSVAKFEGQLEVIVTVRNPGTTPVNGVKVLPVYYSIEDGKETYRPPEPFVFKDVVVQPGEKVALPAFIIPNHLDGSNLSIELPQGVIVQSPRYGLYYCKVCPNGTLTAHLPGYFSGESGETDQAGIYGRVGENSTRLIVFGVFILLIILISRAFCRIACPLGALYAIASPFAISRVTVDNHSCVNCGLCDKACPVGLDVRKEAGNPECIACGDCITACPRGSIRRQFGFSNSTATASPCQQDARQPEGG